MKRVVITGLGVVTPLGNDVPTMWEGLIAGRSGVDRIRQFDASELKVKIAAEVKDFDAEALFGRRDARRHDRLTLFSLECARQAIADAALNFDDELKEATGAIIGTGIGGVLILLENYDVLQERGPHRISPLMVPMMMPNAPSAAITITHDLRGPSFALSSACATGSHAIGEAAEVIRRGDAEVMLCGGTEAALAPLSIGSFDNMKAISRRNDEPQKASRPFDADRDGFVVGEGAGVLVLESMEHARKRGAHIYAELAGYGATSDAYHVAAPEETGAGAAAAMRKAIQNAGLQPAEIDYINAHGTSTELNDRIETLAIHTVFDPHADRLVVSSSKSMLGHLMGAAGAVEAVVCAKTMETGLVHPTVNYETPDPECDLDYVPNQARQLNPRTALSNSFGFGGHNACLVFRRWEANDE